MAMARFNMIDPAGSPEQVAERYRAFLDMAAYMDENGFFAVSLEEHHGVENGWSPTPLMNAGMVLSRTKNITVSISALLLPLHNPIRVAEDIAVLDLISGGRLAVILAIGYRPEEYHLLDKDWDGRGKLMDESLEILLKAFSGEPFDYKGQQVQITPKPLTQPHPTILIGGSSRPAARRAARFGLPMMTSANVPDIEAYYMEQCEANGTQGFCMMPSEETTMLFVDSDPDKAWDELGDYFLNESKLYHSWQTPNIRSQVHSHAGTSLELREEGIYAIKTPAECLEMAKNESFTFTLHPLCGGLPVERGWGCVNLFVDEVLKKL